MNDQERENALNRYASRTVAPAEEAELLRAAMEDQNDFDALVQEELMRELMDDPAARAILLKAAEPERAWTSALKRLLASRVTWAVAGAAACLLIAAGLFLKQPGGAKLTPAGVKQGRTLAEADELPSPLSAEADGFLRDAALRNGVVKIAASFNEIIVSSSRESEVLILAESKGTPTRILAPGAWSEQNHIAANGELKLPLPPGNRVRITALAFPPDFNLSRALRVGGPLPRPLSIAVVGESP